MVTVQDLTKSFGPVKAVDDLSFEIKPGEIVGLLGPNGAGKTTTMRLMTGFLAPDSGTVTIEGVDIQEHPQEVQKKIGYLPENNPLYKEMLVSELFDLAFELSGFPQAKRKPALDFAISAVGVGDHYFRPVGELSKGYQQRVGLALSLLHQPQILIMDEPTEGLDPNQRNEIRSLIKKLAEERTIIMSTHVMQEVTAVCNRILIINRGKLVADGTVEELARVSTDEVVLSIEIEGINVAAILKNLNGIRHVEIEHEKKGKTKMKIAADRSVQLQPEISRLAREHDWTIWHLAEERRDLEDVFRSITKETW